MDIICGNISWHWKAGAPVVAVIQTLQLTGKKTECDLQLLKFGSLQRGDLAGDLTRISEAAALMIPLFLHIQDQWPRALQLNGIMPK